MIKNRIKVLRAERDWTQTDLAKKVSISRQAVISNEKYKYTLSYISFQYCKSHQCFYYRRSYARGGKIMTTHVLAFYI